MLVAALSQLRNETGMNLFFFGQILLALFDAIFLVRPFAQVDEFAAFAAEGTEAVAGVPFHFLAAVRAGDDGWGFFGHC